MPKECLVAAPTQTGLSAQREELFPISPSSTRILEVIRANGQVARADLSALTDLSQQSVHRLAEDLLEKGLLARREPVIQGRGKPSPRLAINPSGAYGFGVSVDTSTVETVWVDLLGNILCRDTIDVPSNDPEAVIKAARVIAQTRREELGLDPSRIAGCGVSTQGFRVTRENRFTTPVLLEKWTGYPIEERFGEEFGCPAYAENNGTLGAIAELWSGAGRTYPTFAYLSFNYGFGGGLVLDGQPFYGFNRNSGEFTSMFLDEEKPNRPALRHLLEILRGHGIDMSGVDSLKANFDPAWPGVAEWVERVTPALNQLNRALCGIIDPAAIVYGGEAPPALTRMLIEATKPRKPDRLGRRIPGPDLVESQIPAEPSAVGAGIQAIRRRVLNQI